MGRTGRFGTSGVSVMLLAERVVMLLAVWEEAIEVQKQTAFPVFYQTLRKNDADIDSMTSKLTINDDTAGISAADEAVGVSTELLAMIAVVGALLCLCISLFVGVSDNSSL